VRTLKDQIALETRSRSLNPKFFEGLLKHGRGRAPDRGAGDQYHGLVGHDRHGRPWVYQRLSETFVLDEEMRRRWPR
jgi:magnesium chelatase subunit H